MPSFTDLFKPSLSYLLRIFSGPRLFWSVVLFFIFLSGFMYGVLTYHFKLWPRPLLQYILIIASQKIADPWWSIYFDGPIPLVDQLGPPIKSLPDIRALNDAILVPSLGFESAYQAIVPGKASLRTVTAASNPHSVLSLPFSYKDKDYTAFSYALDGIDCQGTKPVTLLFPGSGDDQATKIILGEPGNYHGTILKSLQGLGGGQRFLFVKPNHDFRSWHDESQKKLHFDLILNYPLNSGGAYSLSYLLEALAIIRHFKECGRKVNIVGLSDGGLAAYYLGLKSEADRVLVASGFSVVMRNFFISGPRGMGGVPGLLDAYDGDTSQRLICSAPQQKWLFSYALNEGGVYEYDARHRLTEKALSKCPNADFYYHSDGHTFPRPDRIDAFLNLE